MTAASDSMPRHAQWLGVSWEAAIVALCLPPIFLHVRYQPGFALTLGGTDVNAYLSDFAVATIVVVGVVSGVRRGFAPLLAGRWLWASAFAFLLWVSVEVALGREHTSGYPWHAHAISAAKFSEYALLAPALTLVIQRRRDLLAPLWSLTLWSVAAAAVGVAQFFGASILLHGRLGGRQGSFLVESDFSALAGAVLVVGLIALAVPESGLGRRLGIIATASGVVGLILAAAVASVLGLTTAIVVLAIVLAPRRSRLGLHRVAVVAAATALAAAGVVTLRGGDLTSFARFVGSSSSSTQAKGKTVQTYAHHTLLAWIGLRIWEDHPLAGAGWQASGDPATFERYLPAAHRRFPQEPALAFPTQAHPYETQNVWVETLADLGVVGLVLLIAVFVAAARSAWKPARAGHPAALVAMGWAGLLVWLLAAQSLVAGIPLDAILWLALGLAATRSLDTAPI